MVVFSILKLVVLGVATLVAAPMVIVVALFDQRAAYRVCQLWAFINLLAFGVHVRARRLAPVDPGAAAVYMSNHRSQLDPLAVVAAVPEVQLRWVAKKELAGIPVFGWALRRAGNIIIDRSDHAQAVASLRAARSQTDAGISVIIFPEGTRAPRDDVILPFKKGGFMLAIELGLPIVPVAVLGSRTLLPKGSWHVRGGTIDVVVGAPIPVAGMTREALMTAVRAFMLEQMGLPPEAAAPATAEAM
jgi:1-acyl-sn-glycerol-3-phosphate acyltransferase